MTHTNILTIYNEPNYGACLQAYALYKTIEELGGHPRLINLSLDYRAKDYTPLNRLLMWGYRKLKGYDVCYAKAEAFSRKHNPTQTQKFHTLNQLENAQWDTDDVFIIGSDQVWNPGITQRLSRAYCFSFLPRECTRVYSYAASFGNIKDEDDRKRALDMDALTRFKRISVRETFGKDFLKKNGIDATEVVDPTLLRNDYSTLIEGEIKPRRELLFLALSDTDEQQRFVNSLSEIFNLPIRKLYGYLQPSRKINKRFVRIEDWLKAIAESELVVTDSFHAMVFSILFHKQFYIYISEPSKVFRISNLLERLGITSSRIIASAADADPNERIDYSEVDSRLTKLREQSLSYLKAIINENSDL